MKVLLATNNQNKIKEIKQALNCPEITLLTLQDLNLDIEVIEDSDTFQGNAIKKAVEISQLLEEPIPVFADDSGLCVDSLDGRPGVFSHRYMGESQEEGINKLLKELEGKHFEERKAHYMCCMALVIPTELRNSDDNIITVEGRIDGYISYEPKGNFGFAYDPIFYIPEYKQNMAEIDEKTKNSISHRGLALKKICDELLKLKKIYDTGIKLGDTIEVKKLDSLTKQLTTIELGEKGKVIDTRIDNKKVVLKVKFDRNIHRTSHLFGLNNDTQTEDFEHEFYANEIKRKVDKND